MFVMTAPFGSSETHKLIGLQSCQPWSYLSYRACGPRNFMKIAQSRSQNRRGSERRDRSLSGEVEAVYLSDPERAWL